MIALGGPGDLLGLTCAHGETGRRPGGPDLSKTDVDVNLPWVVLFLDVSQRLLVISNLC